MRSHLYRVPSPQPPPQHQVEGILIPARGALLCKGQEGVGGRHVEQGWDPVGDPSLVFLLEQRAVEGARCHLFHDLCKERRQLNVYPHWLVCKFCSVMPFWGSQAGGHRCAQMFIFFYTREHHGLNSIKEAMSIIIYKKLSIKMIRK